LKPEPRFFIGNIWKTNRVDILGVFGSYPDVPKWIPLINGHPGMIQEIGSRKPKRFSGKAMGKAIGKPWYRWPIEIDDFPSELNLHLWLGFSMAMLVITRW